MSTTVSLSVSAAGRPPPTSNISGADRRGESAATSPFGPLGGAGAAIHTVKAGWFHPGPMVLMPLPLAGTAISYVSLRVASFGRSYYSFVSGFRAENGGRNVVERPNQSPLL
jgi:hypothetical protein